MKTLAFLTPLAVAGICASAVPAIAGVNVSLQSAPYVFASFDPSGNSVSNNVATVGSDGFNNGQNVGFWTASYSFNLASANDTLSISDLAADDRVVVELNGTPIIGAGINGPGTGTFIFTPTGSQQPFTFLGNGSQSTSVTSPFIAGTNTIELIVNNTNNGITGGLTGGPTEVSFSGTVTPKAVPEPISGALLLAGVVGTAIVRRGRRGQAGAARG
jgi:hypothetical protein